MFSDLPKHFDSLQIVFSDLLYYFDSLQIVCSDLLFEALLHMMFSAVPLLLFKIQLISVKSNLCKLSQLNHSSLPCPDLTCTNLT